MCLVQATWAGAARAQLVFPEPVLVRAPNLSVHEVVLEQLQRLKVKISELQPQAPLKSHGDLGLVGRSLPIAVRRPC